MMSRGPRTGFTLVELLVVITIIVLVSAVTLPAVLPAFNHREVNEASRILQAALVGVRDAAIRAGEPRGLRLLPDPSLTVPSPGDATGAPGLAGSATLAYDRFVPLEMAPQYTEGFVTIGPLLPPGGSQAPGFPPQYPVDPTGLARGYTDGNFANVYPYLPSNYNPNAPAPFPGTPILMIEQSAFVGGYVPALVNNRPVLNPPTNWYWNIRVGDKIRVGNSGIAYTVVGPMVVGPSGGNAELFVNVGAPGATSPLTRTHYDSPSTLNVVATSNPEFLFLVNGQDDDGDGYVDEGFNGVNEAPCLNGLTDECRPIPPTTMACVDRNGNPASTPAFVFGEWEPETWLGPLAQASLIDGGAGSNSPSATWMAAFGPKAIADARYTITRRPVVSPGAREVPLPASVVIDATSWQLTRERSRLPIDPNTLNVDIILNPSGAVVPTTLYSSFASAQLDASFYHFWLSERQDVHPVNEVWGGTAAAPNANPNGAPSIFLLPMPRGTPGYDAAPLPGTKAPPASLYLKGDRRVVTLFAKDGLIRVTEVAGFDGSGTLGGVNLPFRDAQEGAQDGR